MPPKTKATAIANPSNDAAAIIELSRPYEVEVGIMGVADILFHRYSVEAVAEKAKAKGTRASKTDDVESYIYWMETTPTDRRKKVKKTLGYPTLNFLRALQISAKGHKDPRSARKSAHDLFQAGIVPSVGHEMASFGVETWDYLDRRRAVVNRAGITRVRPALRRGWTITFRIQVLAAQYIDPIWLKKIIDEAGLFQAIGDYRPTFGRFTVVKFATSQ